MPDPTVSFTGDATSLLKAYADMDAARKKEALGLQALKKEHNEAAKAERDAAREAEQIKSRALSAQDKYTAAVGRAKDLLDRNKISQKEYNAELERQTKMLRESENSAGGMGNKIAGAGKEAITAITGIGSALGAVMAVAGAIKAEYEDLKRRQKEALTSQLSFGDAMRSLGTDFKADATMQVADLEPAVQRLMRATGATDSAAAQALSAALAGRGEMSNAQAVGIAEQALRVLPGDADATNQMAMRTGMMMNATGIQDPRAAIGLLTDLKNVSAVAKLRDVGQSGVPAIMGLSRLGSSAEEGAELFATINNLMGDAEGARTETAVNALALQLRDFAPSAKDAEKARIPQTQLSAFRAARTTDERIDVMQQSPALREAFLGDASFELKAKTSIESLLSGSAEAKAVRANARAQIGGPSVKSFETFVGDLNAMQSQSLVRAKADASNRVKLAELSDAAGGRAGLAREIFETTLGKVDLPGFDSLERGTLSGRMAFLEASGATPAAAAATTLEEQVGRGSRSFLAGGGMSNGDLSLMRESIAHLREIARNTGKGAPEDAFNKR